MNNTALKLVILLNLSCNEQMGTLLYSITNRCKLTTPFVQRELYYLKEQQLVEQTCFGLLWRRTASGDQLLEQELRKSYI